jgi:FtsZ-interacting cell division protein ZipA
MNWLLIIIFGIAAIALLIWLAWRNQKDEKEFENQLNNDYRKTKEEEGDIDTEEVVK